MDKPIRVLHVCQRMESAGIQTYLMNIYRNVDKQKIQFDFLVHYKEEQFYDKEIEKYGGRIFRLSVREDYNVFKYIKELNHFFNTHHYDIVHGHMDTLGYLYLRCAKRHNVSIRIAHAHTDSVQKGIKKIPRLIMIRLYGKDANYHFACSRKSGEFMFKNDFIVFRNGIDVKRFCYDGTTREKVRKQFGVEDKYVIGNIGRLNATKNQAYLLKILKELKKTIPNAILIIIGEGQLEKQLRSKIKEYHLEKDVLLLKNRRDVDALYQAMDIFLLPSLFEGIPLVGIEAQAAGLPCIFSDQVNHETSITGNCRFLPLGNTSRWCQEINMIKKEFVRKDVKDKISKEGYDSKKVAKELENFYLSAKKGRKNESRN